MPAIRASAVATACPTTCPAYRSPTAARQLSLSRQPHLLCRPATAHTAAVARSHVPAASRTMIEQLIDPALRESLVEDAVVWAHQHGLLVGAGSADAPAAVVHAPMALLPVPYPRATFLQAKAAATVFNLVMDAVARDEDYLQSVLAAAAEHDEFTAKLLEVLRATAAERAARRDSEGVLAVLRSDYMLHAPTSGLLQVEVNTIASSFGCLSTLVGRMHSYLVGRLAGQAPGLDAAAAAAANPPHNAMDEVVDAMAAAVAEHGTPGGAVLMVVQPGERNAYDQQWLQTRLWERHGLRTLRRSLAELAAQGQLDSSGRLSVGGTAIALAYFRAGYTPADYHSPADWDARLLVERSDAFKCPSVAWQLAGAKKVQQDLAAPGVLERYVPRAEDAALLRGLFAGLWGLEDLEEPAMAAAVADAIRSPEGYVLKPQREGGGNNLYGDALAARLRQGGPGLAAYILMQRILPPMHRAVMVRGGVATEADTLSELGVYGTFVRRGPRVLLNREAGHLVRTKAASSNEGGVAAGYAVLDSPLLVD